MAWRRQILSYLEEQICTTLMVDRPELAFENDINQALNQLEVQSSGDIPIRVNTGQIPMNRMFLAPRVPNSCGADRWNTPLRHFFSRPVNDKDLTGADATDLVPATYLQILGGRQDTGNYGMSAPEPGRLDHQIEYFTFIIHGVFRDRTTRDSGIQNPKVTSELRSGGMSDTWIGNGSVWRDFKNKCQFIPGLPDLSSVPNTKWQIKLDRMIGNLLPSEITIPSNTVIEVNPKCKETDYYDITLQTATANLDRTTINIARLPSVSVESATSVKYDYWRSINEQVIGFVEDIQSVVSLTHVTSIAPEIEGLRQDTFISNTYWGDWAMTPKAENSPVETVSLPLIVKVHYPKNP